MQLVSIGYGKVNFSNASATLVVLHVEPPFVRGLAGKVFTKNSGTIRIPVSDHPEINGALYQDSVRIPEGSIIQLQMRESMRGSSIRDGSIFIRVRTAGAGMIITANVPASSQSILNTNTHQMFLGNGDILTEKELEDEGIILPPQFAKRFMDAEEVGECFHLTILHGAVAPMPVVEKHVGTDGNTVVLKIEKQQRRIRIRR